MTPYSNSTPVKRPQPVVVAGAISAAIPTIVGLLVALRIIDLTPEGAEGLSAAGQSIIGTLVTLLNLVVGAVAILRARDKVTPLADPRDAAGQPLTPDTPSAA